MIGLLPAAGKAERIHGLPKFLLPVEDTYLLKWHIDQMVQAGCENVCIGANERNEDLLIEYAEREEHRYIAHVYEAKNHATMTQTVLSSDRLFTDIFEIDKGDMTIILGMPDTYWTGVNAYKTLTNWMPQYGADVVVAVFEARPGQYKRGGMVRFDANHRVTEVIDKPAETDIKHIWGTMIWKPAFWEHMNPDDPHVGYALTRAIAAGLDVCAVVCDGDFYDVGAPEGYFECIRATTKETA